jgi:hypothetical protein
MQFFVLDYTVCGESPYETQFLDVDTSETGEGPNCPACGGIIGSLVWLPPLKAELLLGGRAFGDIAFGPGDDFLISERLKAIVEEHLVTGFEGFDPVEIVRVSRRRRSARKIEPPGYYRVTVRRTEAAIDQARSGVEWAEPPTCPFCREGDDLQRWQRVVLEEGTWSGEDIFQARGLPATYIASERFKTICEEYKIKNALFYPAEEYGYDFYPWDRPESEEDLKPIG